MSIDYQTNFLPRELRGAGYPLLHSPAAIVGIALLAIIFLVSCWLLDGRSALLKNELAAVEKDIQELAPPAQRVEKIRNERNVRDAVFREYTALLNKRQTWSGLLLDLNRVSPSGVWLVELEAGILPQEKAGSPPESDPGKTVTLTGYAADLVPVGAFLNELVQLPYLQEASLESTCSEQGNTKFKITARLKDGR